VLAPRPLISTTLITIGPLSPRGVALLLFLLRPSDCRANLPFFCTVRQAGYWSRAGMLDHLAGTHKFPLETAAYICPEDVEVCLFPAY